MDAFDADVLIYAIIRDHPMGVRIRKLFTASDSDTVGLGSMLLVPEVLIKPTRLGAAEEVADLRRLLGRLDLRPVNNALSEVAVELAARYALKTVDAVHLATAVLAGADRFVTNNRRDFTKDIVEIDVTYPDELPDSG